MSTNKKFRIQNGADIVGELSINDVTVIGADGKVVAGAIQDAVASLTAADIADLQSQVTAILGTSPETLDTLQEIVTAFEGADSTLTGSVAQNASDIATINTTLTNGVATPTDIATLTASVTAEETRATTAEAANAAAIAAANSRTSGISTSSGSTDIQMTAELDMDSNNIKNANDVYAARGFIDHIEADDLKVQTGTVDFEGSIVNFGSSTITGSGFGNATKTEVDQHLNISTANAGEFVKWTGTDYEWTDLVSGRLATDQLQIASGGSITATGPGGTFDFQDGIVMLSGSDVRVDTPTDVGQAANKGYVDGVVAATVDAAPAALDTLNELAAALGDDANFSATVATSIGTKASQTDHDAEVAARIAAVSSEASTRSSADAALQAEIDALEVLQSGDVSGLQAQINAEAGRAASAEAVNAANIVSETSARSSADAALESDIIGLQNQVSTIISGSPASLDTLVEIVSAFETADASLSGVITANGGRLTTAENNITALEADLTAEESARGAGDVALQANIDAEATTRSNLGSQLLGYININGAAITAGDNANSAEIATEKSRAEGAEATLQSNIDALTSSTGGDVSGLQANIDAEASTRSSADSALQSSIDAEETRATSAEAGLQSQISNVLSNTDATALNSLAEIVAEFQSADSTLTGAVAGHGTRLTSLESSTSAILAWDTDNVSEGSTNKYWTPERTKTALSGGLCITYNSTTGEIKIDEAETASSLHVASSSDANELGGQAPSHYRIDVYDVNGTVVN
jgi:hypothetical protein